MQESFHTMTSFDHLNRSDYNDFRVDPTSHSRRQTWAPQSATQHNAVESQDTITYRDVTNQPRPDIPRSGLVSVDHPGEVLGDFIKPLTRVVYSRIVSSYNDPECKWASRLVDMGALVLPPNKTPLRMPFHETEPHPSFDAAVKQMVRCGVLVLNDDIKSAFPLTTLTTANGTVEVVLDFQDWKSLYPKRQCYKLFTSAKSIQRVSPYDKMIKITLTNIFYQMKVMPNVQKFLGLIYRNRRYSWNRLPPNHPESSQILQRWAEIVGRILEKKFNVYTVIFQDVWLVHGVHLNPNPIVKFLTEVLGIHIDGLQSVLEPTAEVDYLGFHVSSLTQTLQLTKETRSRFEMCMSNSSYDQYDMGLWWWVAYHLRLPRLVEEEFLLGKTDVLEIIFSKLNLEEPKSLKRSQRMIVIYTDVSQGRVLAYAPEFQKYINEGFLSSNSESPQALEILSVIISSKWAIDTFVPDGVNLTVYINSERAYSACLRGSSLLRKNLLENYIGLYKSVHSRSIMWRSTDSSISMRELADHIQDMNIAWNPPAAMQSLELKSFYESRAMKNAIETFYKQSHQAETSPPVCGKQSPTVDRHPSYPSVKLPEIHIPRERTSLTKSSRFSPYYTDRRMDTAAYGVSKQDAFSLATPEVTTWDSGVHYKLPLNTTSQVPSPLSKIIRCPDLLAKELTQPVVMDQGNSPLCRLETATREQNVNNTMPLQNSTEECLQRNLIFRDLHSINSLPISTYSSLTRNTTCAHVSREESCSQYPTRELLAHTLHGIIGKMSSSLSTSHSPGRLRRCENRNPDHLSRSQSAQEPSRTPLKNLSSELFPSINTENSGQNTTPAPNTLASSVGRECMRMHVHHNTELKTLSKLTTGPVASLEPLEDAHSLFTLISTLNDSPYEEDLNLNSLFDIDA